MTEASQAPKSENKLVPAVIVKGKVYISIPDSSSKCLQLDGISDKDIAIRPPENKEFQWWTFYWRY